MAVDQEVTRVAASRPKARIDFIGPLRQLDGQRGFPVAFAEVDDPMSSQMERNRDHPKRPTPWRRGRVAEVSNRAGETVLESASTFTWSSDEGEGLR